MQFKSVLGLVAAAAILSFSTVSATQAETAWFNLEGEGAGEFNFEVTELETVSVESGAFYDFNGGAGTNGNALAKGEYTGVGGLFFEQATGGGNALSDTLGNNYATSNFSSEAFSANGGFAADLDLAGLNSKMSYEGLAVAGGAGQANSGLTWTNTTTNGWSAAFDYDVEADGGLNYGSTP